MNNSDNIFFDIFKLKKLGKNVIIGKTVRIRYPELVEIGNNVIIDDFTYISTSLKIHNNVHISSECKTIGGKKSFVEMKDYSTLAPNVVLSAGSDNYIGGIATPMIPLKYKGNAQIGKIVINKHCIVGAASIVLPDVTFHEGSSVDALSLVNKDLKDWNKIQILNLEKKVLSKVI